MRGQGPAVMCCAVLCCAVLCCAVLCCAVLCCAVLCCAVDPLLPAERSGATGTPGHAGAMLVGQCWPPTPHLRSRDVHDDGHILLPTRRRRLHQRHLHGRHNQQAGAAAVGDLADSEGRALRGRDRAPPRPRPRPAAGAHADISLATRHLLPLPLLLRLPLRLCCLCRPCIAGHAGELAWAKNAPKVWLPLSAYQCRRALAVMPGVLCVALPRPDRRKARSRGYGRHPGQIACATAQHRCRCDRINIRWYQSRPARGASTDRVPKNAGVGGLEHPRTPLASSSTQRARAPASTPQRAMDLASRSAGHGALPVLAKITSSAIGRCEAAAAAAAARHRTPGGSFTGTHHQSCTPHYRWQGSARSQSSKLMLELRQPSRWNIAAGRPRPMHAHPIPRPPAPTPIASPPPLNCTILCKPLPTPAHPASSTCGWRRPRAAPAAQEPTLSSPGMRLGAGASSRAHLALTVLGCRGGGEQQPGKQV